VTIHDLERGEARQVLYSPNLFEIPPGNPARSLPADLGFAGFRVMNPHAEGDWIAYLGASYFRAADPFNQYGLSARGLAIDTAADGPEEFPTFTSFWIERAPQGLVVYALLEGPSVTGAYRMVHRRGAEGMVQEIEARLNFRAAVKRLGVAPLTSMFWYGPGDRTQASDWRPQIHDSDGLSLWTGTGERIWRPLGNPPRVVTNTFLDSNPKGFGLMQRDRLFADYQDDGAFYERRPSAWVEPTEDWGAGSVGLVEIPTEGENLDNIVAFWTPERSAQAGDSLNLRYRLHWAAKEPIPPGVAQVVATRVGRGGRPGQPPPPGLRKYVVDFEGGRLATLDRQSGVKPVVTLSEGDAIEPSAYPVVGAGRWRLMFDIAVPAGKTIDMRAFLRLGEDSLTETWIEQVMGSLG
jgi:glucans biosynthesis protein